MKDLSAYSNMGMSPKQGTGTGIVQAPYAPTGYATFDELTFPAMRPFTLGIGTPTPNNTMGNTNPQVFTKINNPVNDQPYAKIVIQSQLLTPIG